MRYSIRTVTPATAPLLSLPEAKQHLRVDGDEEDALIEAYARAAQDFVERHTSRLLAPVTLEYACAGFPCAGRPIVIPRDPITEIVAISYTDLNGEAVELDQADWRWSEGAPDHVLPAFGQSWPSAAAEPGSVRNTLEAGYETGLCPPALSAAVRLMLGTLYGQRESVVTGTIVSELPLGVQALCSPYRRVTI